MLTFQKSYKETTKYANQKVPSVEGPNWDVGGGEVRYPSIGHDLLDHPLYDLLAAGIEPWPPDSKSNDIPPDQLGKFDHQPDQD